MNGAKNVLVFTLIVFSSKRFVLIFKFQSLKFDIHDRSFIENSVKIFNNPEK